MLMNTSNNNYLFFSGGGGVMTNYVKYFTNFLRPKGDDGKPKSTVYAKYTSINRALSKRALSL